MSRLLKHISPLAPDDSGACSVLYELGGITVICDAGGCAGNVCGFDEPRWHEKPSALFSAGLRDMDAILGRDDMLVQKLARVCEQIPAAFTAIVGTPVPAVIATDFTALKRMSEKKTGLPCITVETDGTGLYDQGEELAYLKLMKEFAKEQYPTKKGKLGVLGATPLNTGLTAAEPITRALRVQGWNEVICFGLDSGLDAIRRASECERILVISPSGIKAAVYLETEFGIPYETGYPYIPDTVAEPAKALRGKRVLIIHEPFAANALRDLLTDCEADCATWFTLKQQYAREHDFRIRTEDDLADAAARYDVIIGDNSFRRILPDKPWISFPHYAVSAEVTPC